MLKIEQVDPFWKNRKAIQFCPDKIQRVWLTYKQGFERTNIFIHNAILGLSTECDSTNNNYY